MPETCSLSRFLVCAKIGPLFASLPPPVPPSITTHPLLPPLTSGSLVMLHPFLLAARRAVCTPDSRCLLPSPHSHSPQRACRRAARGSIAAVTAAGVPADCPACPARPHPPRLPRYNTPYAPLPSLALPPSPIPLPNTTWHTSTGSRRHHQMTPWACETCATTWQTRAWLLWTSRLVRAT